MRASRERNERNHDSVLLPALRGSGERSARVWRLLFGDLPALRLAARIVGRLGLGLTGKTGTDFSVPVTIALERRAQRTWTELSVPFCLSVASVLFSVACGSRVSQEPAKESAYVGPAQLTIRKDIAGKSPVVATLHHGDKLDLLETRRRFARVRTAAGVEGWTDSNLLMSTQQMDNLTVMAEETSKLPSQGLAQVNDTLNVHADPSRQSPSVYQIPEKGTVEVIGHRVTQHNPPLVAKLAPPKKLDVPKAKKGVKPDPNAPLEPPPSPAPSAPPLNWQELSRPRARDLTATAILAARPAAADDWTLIRTKDGKVGWVLARMLVMNIPDDVAQYAEGHRITSYLPLGEVHDKEKGETKNNWLWTTITGGLQPYEFDSFRVFVWSAKRHHYETALIEKNVRGYYPVESVELPGHDEKGFSLIVEDKDGTLFKRTYGFSGYHVRMISKDPYALPAEPSKRQAQPAADKEAPKNPGLWDQVKDRWAKFRGKPTQPAPNAPSSNK